MHAHPIRYLGWFSIGVGLKNFCDVKWAERHFLISMYEQNYEIKFSVSIATQHMEIGSDLDVNFCV